jgi:flagellar assembly factor FliW
MSVEMSTVQFPQGIPGFQDLRDFVIQKHEEDSPFYLMQATDNEDIGFVLVNPFEVFRNYEFQLPDSAKELLEIDKMEQIAVYSLVTLRNPIEESTTNLLAPIVINSANKKGVQVVLMEEKLSIQEKLFAISQDEGAK